MAQNQKDSLREKFFSPKNFKRKKIKLFDVSLEVRQPSVKQLNELWEVKDDKGNAQNAAVRLIIEYAYLPGSDTKLFDESDYDGLMAMPYGDWVTEFQDAWLKVSGLDKSATDKAKNSEATSGDATS